MVAKTKRASGAQKAFPPARRSRAPARHVLRLYVAGATARSREAILRARQLCETELPGAFELHVIDVYQHPILARDGQIIATPTLIREFPRPVRRFFGNLADTTGLFVGMDLKTKAGRSS